MKWRKIVVREKEFSYIVGTSYVKVVGPHGSMLVDISTLTGKTWDVIERGRRKKATDGMVTPGMVAKWVEGQMKGSGR